MKKKIKTQNLIILFLTVLLLSSCKVEEPDLSFTEYNDYYGLDFPGIAHNAEFLSLAGYSIAVHSFKPANPLGTVTVVHGYYDHVAIEKNLISYLLDNQYSVLAYDLPGHGLSSGEKADIGDFTEYTTVLRELNALVLRDFSPPYHLIGHSTGGAIIIDGLLNKALGNISKIILVSPLIHSNLWNISQLGNWITDIFVDSVPRIFRKNSSDDEYLDFVKNRDPLQYRKVPLKWFKALVLWNNKIIQAEESDREILVLQGSEDSTVDWKYNLKFIQDKFRQSKIVMIKDGNHQLFNENIEIQDQVFMEITNYLK